MYQWDEAKREANLQKHGLDFLDAHIVYENPNKVTYPSQKRGEHRLQDIALVEINGDVLSLTYVLRGDNVRVNSFRNASRRERRVYGIQRQSP